MVPEGWVNTPLDNVFKLTSGKTKPTDVCVEKNKETPNPVYGGNGVLGWTGQSNHSGNVILIGRVGEYCGVTRHINEPCWITDNALYSKNFYPENDIKFITYRLQHFDISRLRSKGGQPLISQKPIYLTKLNLPPLPEQRKIAEILSTWDRAIEVSEALLATARTQKRALMQALLTGKRRFPEFEGQEWKEVRLGDVTGIDRSSLGSNTSPEFEFEYISLSNIEPGRIVAPLGKLVFRDAPSRARRIVQSGDILISTVRPNLLGFAQVSDEFNDCIASTGFAVATCGRDADPSFVFHYLFSHHMTGQIHALVVGSNYPAINSSDVRKLKTNMPSLAEQERIGIILNDCDIEINTHADETEKLRTEKKALMQQLLTGKRRVTV